MTEFQQQLIKELGVPSEALGIRRMMEFLVKDEEDYEELNAAIIEHNFLFHALASMRKNRLGKLTFEQFLNLYKLDKINALEELFQEKIRERDLSQIDKKSVTPLHIFEKHKEMPNVSFMQVIYKEL